MITVYTGKGTARIPSRKDCQTLKVGDLAPNCFGNMERVVSIHAQKEDIHGRAFVCYYTRFGDNGSTISGSMKEGELLRDVQTSKHHTSAELDDIERRSKNALLVRPKRDYVLAGALKSDQFPIRVSSKETYLAFKANNLPDWEKDGLVFVGDLLLAKDEYTIVEE